LAAFEPRGTDLIVDKSVKVADCKLVAINATMRSVPLGSKAAKGSVPVVVRSVLVVVSTTAQEYIFPSTSLRVFSDDP